MLLEHKSFGVAELKATGQKSGGEFEAIVSVFGNVDRDGDRMVPGAFKRSLQAPPDGLGLPPIVWSHQWGVPPIGASLSAEEVTGQKAASGTVDGLYVKGELFVDDNSTAREVYAAMSRKGGDDLPPLRQFSFGYRPVEFEFVTEKSAGKTGRVRELKDVDLLEVGPCLVGVNSETQLLGTKSELAALLSSGKAGARNSKEDADRIQQIHDLALELGATPGDSGDPEKSLRVVDGKFGKALGRALGKAYDDIDSSAIWALTSMIERGCSFIAGETDDADIARMRTLLAEIAAMLADEIAEVEPDSGVGVDEILEMAALPTSGEQKSTLPLDLLLAHPRHT